MFGDAARHAGCIPIRFPVELRSGLRHADAEIKISGIAVRFLSGLNG